LSVGAIRFRLRSSSYGGQVAIAFYGLKQHRQLAESGQGHRIVWEIKRRNEDGSVYDLCRTEMWTSSAAYFLGHSL
jgi:hypothetical protein